MLDPDVRKLMEEVWTTPLFDAFFSRRSRRFPVGCEIKHGPNAYKSSSPPEPLSLEEEALLCMAATGLSGMNLADMPHTRKEELAPGEGWDGNCNTMLEYNGRVFPSPCGSHATELFYTNDEGTYVVKMRDLRPEKMRELATMDDMEKLVAVFKERRIQLDDERIDLPHSMPALMSFNTWNANMPGTTLFMPVVDVTEELLNGLMLMLEQGNYPVDAFDGFKPLGCERWVKSGLLHTPAPYQYIEPAVGLGASNIEVGFMGQNLLLTTAAMGLGGWPFGGFNAMMLLGGTPVCRGLCFRFETAERGPYRGFPYPIGKDEFFETHHPHYFKGSIDDAIDDIVERKWGGRGIFNPANAGQAPYKNPGQMEQGIPRTDPDIVQATKDVMNAVIKKYGRFPALIDGCVMTCIFQAHHLELGFYDQYYREGAYTDRHRHHMEKWHGKKRAQLKAA